MISTLRVGLNAAAGLVRDLWRTRSLKRLIEDIAWAGRGVAGRQFGYPGEVVLLFGSQDTVMRWRDAFPECEQPDDIADVLPAFHQESFRLARLVEVQVIEGSHVGPEVDAARFLETGLGLLRQLDGSAL